MISIRRLLLGCGLLMALASSGSAQPCTPIPYSPETPVFLPEPYQPEIGGTGIMDSACVGSPFRTVFNVSVPSQMVIANNVLPVTGFTVATTGAISGMPASMSYACNPPDCVFPANTVGCIAVTGTPQPGEEGVYDVIISGVIQNSFFPLPFTVPDPALFRGNYFLHVRPADGSACRATATIRSSWGTLRTIYR
jgi:hypothetical protein